jgi:nucleoid-associated protein YgaU
MIFFPRKLVTLLAIPLLTQCGYKSAPPTQSVTGPYDSRGNYVEDWVDQPDKWYSPPAPGSHSKPNKTIAANHSPEPVISPVVTSSPPEITRTSPAKVKPQQSVIRYTVKRGDNLSVIANRYKTTVSKIQKANGLRSSVIRVGQSLKIPR